MNWTDLVILVVAGGFAWLGWNEGLVRAVWAFTGLILGTMLGIVLVPVMFGGLTINVWVSLASLGVVAVAAVATRAVMVQVEKRLRSRIAWTPRAAIDRPAGSAFGVGATLSISWMLGLALLGSNLPHLSSAAGGSLIVNTMDSLDLPLNQTLRHRLDDLGEESDFDLYVGTFEKEKVVDVPPAPNRVIRDKDVRRASRSVWRVVSADGSAMGKQGTAFLVGPQRVMTAAHVVDGADRITLHHRQGESEASVVVCDPEHDIAVLEVPGLEGRALSFAEAVGGDPAVVIGFPGDGPLRLRAARVRDRQEWQAPDIWQEGRYEHDAYALRAQIHVGNSGGPVVDLDGNVLGLVVATSREHAATGYALTADQVAEALRQGLSGDVGSADDCG